MLGCVMDDGQVGGVRQRGFVVRRLVVPPAGAASWTVIGRDRRPVEPVEAFLRWLTDTERSPNTVRAYAGDVCQFWEFLELRGYDWADLGLEELGDFTGWLRSPAENVIVLANGKGGARGHDGQPQAGSGRGLL